MAKRTWTYDDLTLAAESRIASNIQLASEAQAAGDNYSANIFTNFACGAFCFWESLTMGWQNEGDSARLQAMTEVRRG